MGGFAKVCFGDKLVSGNFMKHIIFTIFILLTTFCFGQKVKRKVENPGPNAQTVVQYIYEYDTLGRKTREILTSNTDTLEYQFEILFFYDNENKLQIEIKKHSYDLLYTIYYYDKKNSLCKSSTFNSNEKKVSYKLYKQNQWTEYITGGKRKPRRVQTTVVDSLGNKTNFYGWEKSDGRKDKWNYKFVNEYSQDKKLIKTELYTSDKKLYETTTFENNSFGLVTRETRVTGNSKPYIDKQIRYDYY